MHGGIRLGEFTLSTDVLNCEELKVLPSGVIALFIDDLLLKLVLFEAL